MTTRIAPNADRFVDLSAGCLPRSGRDADFRSLGPALDAEPSWKDEASRYIEELAIDTVVAPSDTNITPDSMAAFARRHPNEARSFAWDRLSAWATAFKAGNAGAAERHLRIAEAAGFAIIQGHTDPSIADAVAAIRTERVATGRLADAHLKYTDGQKRAREGKAAQASDLYKEVARVTDLSPALAAWASYGAGQVRLTLMDLAGTERAMREIIASPAAERYPALAARCHWTLGVVLLRNRQDTNGTMTGILGEAARLAGDSRTAYQYFAEALHILREYPLSVWRQDNLTLMSRGAADQGRRLARTLPVSNQRPQLETELSVESVDLTSPDLSVAMAVLDTAVDYFSRMDNHAKQLRAYAARASLSLRRGDVKRADHDLDRALTIFEQRRDGMKDPTQQALLVEQARRVSEALTMLRLSRGDAAGALDARERARERRIGLLPADRNHGIVIELALIADTLVLFTRRGDSVAAIANGRGAALRADIDLLQVALERGAPAAVWEPILERLHQRLIAPVAGELTATDTVISIVADGVLSRVPFAALRNAADGRYLIERYALRVATSQRKAMESRAALPDSPRALLVANPALDRRSYPQLASLPPSAREVDAIAGFLKEPRVLRGAEANTATVTATLPGAEVFHFSGPALVDGARPQRSQLAMGSRGMTAAAIAKMRLPALKLVVLSACETERSGPGDGAGFLGLAESFMSAGAEGVVGSLWKVGDEATGQLMQEFYRALSRSHDPVLALRDAQVSMRTLPPTAWAAFRYAGR